MLLKLPLKLLLLGVSNFWLSDVVTVFEADVYAIKKAMTDASVKSMSIRTQNRCPKDLMVQCLGTGLLVKSRTWLSIAASRTSNIRSKHMSVIQATNQQMCWQMQLLNVVKRCGSETDH